MLDEDKAKEQLIDELVEMRRRIKEIVHDLNNPLTVIMGNIGIARILTNDGKTLEKLAEAEEATRQLRDLVAQLAALTDHTKVKPSPA